MPCSKSPRGKIACFWLGPIYPKAHVLCPFTEIEIHPICMRLILPTVLLANAFYIFPRTEEPPNCLILLTLGPLTQKVIKTHLKNKIKSFNPRPEAKHPSLYCHKQANMKSRSGKLSEGINWWWKHYAADNIWWWCKQGCLSTNVFVSKEPVLICPFQNIYIYMYRSNREICACLRVITCAGQVPQRTLSVRIKMRAMGMSFKNDLTRG